MDTFFPTFRRWGSNFPAGAVIRVFRRRGPVRAQQRSLLRLILAAHEEKLTLGQLGELVAAWSEDESGRQSFRLLRLAELLQAGTPLPNAIEQVRDILSDEDVLAIRFGFQSGTLSATIRDQLDQPVSPFEYGSLRVRNLFPYLTIVLIVSSFIVTFFMIKIVPVLRQIFAEFDIQAPSSLAWNASVSSVVANYWFVFALGLLGLWLVVFMPWPGRRVRLWFTSNFFRPARDLRFASVLQNLSVAAKAGRPISGALSTLARYHFDPVLRNQLLFIRNELDHGASVWHSMGAVGLLSDPEMRALESSERVGDRVWVLQQLAQLKRRRTRWRFARWAELALPAIVLILGAFVLLQALSMFQGLLSIVYSLL